MNKWDRFFLDMAKLTSRASKDPSTKVGAVIARGKRVVSIGFNGFPQRTNDDAKRYADRSFKIQAVQHGEANAMTFARGCDGCTLYTYPFMPCANCAGRAIQEGIIRIVAPYCPNGILERWGNNLEIAKTLLEEAGVTLDLVNYE